ncbi:MAG: rubrerythrin family protein [Planctomycetota bacterium]|jgi:rubrerythrin|nr:rubrerythrin family protein [Planctomycetota bacterium]
MEMKGSRTAKNVLTAFAGESQARNRYTFFSSKARAEGYVQIADIFEETAGHEREHAKRLFKFMTGAQQEIAAAYPFGIVGSTVDNLQESANGEKHEYTVMYPEFANIADEEGFHEIADAMRHIAVAEEYHERRYLALKKNLLEGTVFKKPQPIKWKCRNCGYQHQGGEAPAICPACAHPRAHFEVLCENY